MGGFRDGDIIFDVDHVHPVVVGLYHFSAYTNGQADLALTFVLHEIHG
jgi:hypothetical protein